MILLSLYVCMYGPDARARPCHDQLKQLQKFSESFIINSVTDGTPISWFVRYD